MPAIAPFRGLRPAPAGAAAVRDPVPALYRYEIAFGPPEARRHATGFLARVAVGAEPELAPAGAPSAPPHPSHPPHPPADDGEPVVLRYPDLRGWIDEVLHSNALDEVVRRTDPDGSEHRVWRVDRPQAVEEVVAQFEDRPLRVERGHAPLRAAQEQAARGRPAALLALLAPEGPEPAPWQAGLVRAADDEPVPRPWAERAGGPGPARWRRPPLG